MLKKDTKALAKRVLHKMWRFLHYENRRRILYQKFRRQKNINLAISRIKLLLGQPNIYLPYHQQQIISNLNKYRRIN